MFNLNKLSSVALIALFSFPVLTHAGASSNVQACIHLPVKATSDLTVRFNVGGTGSKCMDKVGQNAVFTVPKGTQGVACTSVGFVEADSSLGCKTRDSLWPLAYSVDGTSMSGGAVSKWAQQRVGHVDTVSLDGEFSPGTMVCSNAVLCKSTELVFEQASNSQVFIVFQPWLAAGSASSADLKNGQ